MTILCLVMSYKIRTFIFIQKNHAPKQRKWTILSEYYCLNRCQIRSVSCGLCHGFTGFTFRISLQWWELGVLPLLYCMIQHKIYTGHMRSRIKFSESFVTQRWHPVCKLSACLTAGMSYTTAKDCNITHCKYPPTYTVLYGDKIYSSSHAVTYLTNLKFGPTIS